MKIDWSLAKNVTIRIAEPGEQIYGAYGVDADKHGLVLTGPDNGNCLVLEGGRRDLLALADRINTALYRLTGNGGG